MVVWRVKIFMPSSVLRITSKVTGKMPLLGYEIDGEMNLTNFPGSGLALRVEST